MKPVQSTSTVSQAGRSVVAVSLFIALVCGAFIVMNTSGPVNAAQEKGSVQENNFINNGQGFVLDMAQQRACPDTTLPLLTATATREVTPTATRNVPVTPMPRVIVSSGLFEVTQESMFNVNHSIWEFDPGLTFGPISYLGPVNFIVEMGEITYCSGRFQRLYKVGEAFSVPANLAFQLTNSGATITRLSIARLRPLSTPTATGTLTETMTLVPTTTGTLTATLVPTQAVTATTTTEVATAAVGTPGYLGIRVASINGTLKVLAFLANSPAANVLQVNDVITALDDQPLTSLLSSTGGDVDFALINAFFDTIAARGANAQVKLTIQRTTNGNTETIDVPITLGVNPAG